MQAQRQTSLARPILTRLLAGACALLLAACGQKGPLTLPAAAPAAASAPAPVR